MKIKTQQRWVWAVVVSSILITLAWSASAQEPAKSISVIMDDGRLLREVIVLQTEGDKVYLSHRQGGGWFSLDSLSDDARKQLGLATREERWLNEAMNSLKGPNHEVSFIGPDGEPTRKDSSLLTTEEQKLYIEQYAEKQKAVRPEEADKKARGEDGRAEAETRLDGPNHEVSFTWPDEQPAKKDLSLLAVEEKELYIRRCAEEQAALRREEADKMAREEHWRHEAGKNLAEPNHAAAFLGLDGNLIKEASLLLTLTAEKRKLYLKQYVEKWATVRASLSDGRLGTRGQTGTATANNPQPPQQAPLPPNNRPPASPSSL